MHISSDDQSDSLATHCTLEMAMEREVLSHTKSWCFYMFYVSLKKDVQGLFIFCYKML